MNNELGIKSLNIYRLASIPHHFFRVLCTFAANQTKIYKE